MLGEQLPAAGRCAARRVLAAGPQEPPRCIRRCLGRVAQGADLGHLVGGRHPRRAIAGRAPGGVLGVGRDEARIAALAQLGQRLHEPPCLGSGEHRLVSGRRRVLGSEQQPRGVDQLLLGEPMLAACVRRPRPRSDYVGHLVWERFASAQSLDASLERGARSSTLATCRRDDHLLGVDHT